MSGIPFIDISNTNCWLVNLLPFGDNSKIEDIKAFQSECINKLVFGMGWDCLYSKDVPYIELDKDEKRNICLFVITVKKNYVLFRKKFWTDIQKSTLETM